MSEPTRNRIVTQRRKRPFRWGIILIAAGVASLAIGVLLTIGSQALAVADASDRSEIPKPLEFTAEAGDYTIILLPTNLAIPFKADPVAQLRCDVTLSDGSTTTIDGSRQGSSLSTPIGDSVGNFDATAGPTTVMCDFTRSDQSSNYYVVVAPQRKALQFTALGLVIGGIVTALIGAYLLYIGIRGRAVVVPQTRGQATVSP